MQKMTRSQFQDLKNRHEKPRARTTDRNRYDTEPKNTTQECARRVRQWSRLFDAECAKCWSCKDDRLAGGSGMCLFHKVSVLHGALSVPL